LDYLKIAIPNDVLLKIAHKSEVKEITKTSLEEYNRGQPYESLVNFILSSAACLLLALSSFLLMAISGTMIE